MRSFNEIKNVIIKIGSSSLVNKDLSVNLWQIDNIFKSISELMNKGISVSIVTSGAIATGMHELRLTTKPKDMALKQACAAVGQSKLMEGYNHIASKYNIVTGQILINHDDFQKRSRLTHLENTLNSMLKNKIVPIINENDALSVDEIKVGDNDTLSALVATLIKADLLILFSDIDGLFTKNPKIYSDATLINEVKTIDEKIYNMVSGSTTMVGTGGMETKINAAIITTNCGVNMIICNSERIKDLTNIVSGEEIGTLFIKSQTPILAKEGWMMFNTNPEGEIIIDKGLEKKLVEKKVSILPVGIKEVNGDFAKNSVINVRTIDGNIICKGITNYSSSEIRLFIYADNKKDIEKVLGLVKKKEIIHASNLVRMEDEYERIIK